MSDIFVAVLLSIDQINCCYGNNSNYIYGFTYEALLYILNTLH